MASQSVDNIVVAGKSGAGKQPRIDVLVSELGLLTNGDPANNYLPLPSDYGVTESKLLPPSAYKSFEPFGKTPAMQLELSWEIRF